MVRAMHISALDADHAAAALRVARRAIRRTEGSPYTPAQIEAWLAGLKQDRLGEHLQDAAAFGFRELNATADGLFAKVSYRFRF